MDNIKQEDMLAFVCRKAAQSKPVKLAASRTYFPLQWVFCAQTIIVVKTLQQICLNLELFEGLLNRKEWEGEGVCVAGDQCDQ